MMNPIVAANEIKNSFADYIMTSMAIADKEYARQFKEQLMEEGAIAKGPYVELNDTFEKGSALLQLIEDNTLSNLFKDIESKKDNEDRRELPIERNLWAHQERAVRQAVNGENLVVTTGTGSGKTECFLIPIINALLRELEHGTLSPGVRALIVYPMNALANDQMKRLRSLLNCFSAITFGLYNGSTEEEQASAVSVYKEMLRTKDNPNPQPIENEILDRETMREAPPHILITNYAMLEHMLLRPKDDQVFLKSQIRFIVLDEAHIYKGATGIETSMLLRRLKARINVDSVQFILTSATLGGGEESNPDIVTFAKNLCGVYFDNGNIIRAKAIPAHIDIKTTVDGVDIFKQLANNPGKEEEILANHDLDFTPSKPLGEKLYELCIRSEIYCKLREHAKRTLTIFELANSMMISRQDLVDVINICVKAEKNGYALLQARYHFFARALEGAFITLKTPKRLFLQRKQVDIGEFGNEPKRHVFECAVCEDCGRIAITGKVSHDHLTMTANNWESCSSFLIKEQDDGEYFSQDDIDAEVDEESGTTEFDYIVCSSCGMIVMEGAAYDMPCSCGRDKYVKVREAVNNKCPACEQGDLKRFYIGEDAATAVLGTALYEQLPNEEIVVSSKVSSPTSTSIFARSSQTKSIRRNIGRQFLCFSDSRHQAAFFACYMSSSYKEFLRRRGIWHVIEKNRSELIRRPITVDQFVEELLAPYFDEHKTFASVLDDVSSNLAFESKRNAWIAVLNEMFNARRKTSLSSLGVLSFEYAGNKNEIVQILEAEYKMTTEDARAFLNLLSQDIMYNGAFKGNFNLIEDDREYIFYSSVQKAVAKLKTSASNTSQFGWMAKCRANQPGKFYANSRLLRTANILNMEHEEANKFLDEYFEGVLQPDMEVVKNTIGFVMPTQKYIIRVNGDERLAWYKCEKCGRVTQFNCMDQCASIKCRGKLNPIDPSSLIENNHYANLYASERLEPLHIKEHTAQLGRKEGATYQQLFIEKKLNALSCSTTFEMGIDLGDLETVFLRNVPPSPANYVQRTGRTGRNARSASFAITYAKLSSHDFTYYEKPTAMISGRIKPPLFVLENEKILLRHVFAVALSSFFSYYPEVYNKNDARVLLDENGFELLKQYVCSKPTDLCQLLLKSIPTQMLEKLGIDDFSWTENLIGENGILTSAVQDYRNTVKWFELRINELPETELAQKYAVDLKLKKFKKNKLIEFLVRNNVLPKYGFPVDTVELHQNMDTTQTRPLTLVRDLQLAIADYAPGSQVVADGKLYTSRYIRKLPTKSSEKDWETVYVSTCPNSECQTVNYSRIEIDEKGQACSACEKLIPQMDWEQSIEPRKGFVAEQEVKEVPMRRPDKTYRSNDSYIGDIYKNEIIKQKLNIGEKSITLESTTNDSLMVIAEDSFYVCNVCGYAIGSSDKLGDKSAKQARDAKSKKLKSVKHRTAYGNTCKSEEMSKYRLTHTFRTDVVRVTFDDNPLARDKGTMLSVLYALLEGVSRQLDVERNDIKGCLHKARTISGSMVNSIVLYDGVPGGAGHVRRLVQEEGSILAKVIDEAIALTKNCTCDPSCYKCLRNYYNQTIHDQLDRNAASAFLLPYQGSITVSIKSDETSERVEGGVLLVNPQWDEVIEFASNDLCRGIARSLKLLKVEIPQQGFEIIDKNGVCGQAEFAWPDKKIAILSESDMPNKDLFINAGWSILRDVECDTDLVYEMLKK